MKRLTLLTALLLMLGCKYSTPLTTEPGLPVEPKLIGSWEMTSDGDKHDRMVILPLDDREYLVEYPAGGADSMYYRAVTLTNAAGSLAQLKLLGTPKEALKKGEEPYQIARWTLDGDSLRLAILNVKIVGEKHATPADFAKVIVDNAGNPELFDDPATFKRVK